ncbi:MAG: chemotaxis protein CheW [Myxococcota bacterium]
MSELATARENERRLLSFEVGGARFALPISGVIEVAKVDFIACIPTLPVEIGGVINHRGDVLPVLRHGSLLDVDRADSSDPTHVLVVSDPPTTSGTRLGLLVDRVLGLVDGDPAVGTGTGPVAERRPIDGRVSGVIDPQRLVARAREVIERSLVRSG